MFAPSVLPSRDVARVREPGDIRHPERTGIILNVFVKNLVLHQNVVILNVFVKNLVLHQNVVILNVFVKNLAVDFQS